MVERLTRNPRIFILAALILALIAAALVYLLLSNATRNTTNPTGTGRPGAIVTTTVPVKEVVALSDVPPYTVLNNATLINKYFGEQMLPGGTTLPADAFASMTDFLTYLSSGHPGRYTSGIIVQGQIIRKGNLGDLNGRQAFSLSLVMPTQRVAESVSVAPLASANAGIQAGDQVDVLLTLSTDALYNYRDARRQAGPSQTQTLLENVPVLAAAPPMYTLMLNHQDAALLKFVKDNNGGGIELVLRSWLDVKAHDFRTSPILPAYLTTNLRNNFTTPPAPLASTVR